MAMQILPYYLNLFSKPWPQLLASATEPVYLEDILKAKVDEPQ